MSLFQTTALDTAGIDTGPVADAVRTRANIMQATQAAEDAVMAPLYAGAFSHDLRAALAARMAQSGGVPELATRYLARAGDMAPLADPASDGAAQGLAHIIAFVDRAANATRDVAASDISGLQAASVSDADIVRLCELVAFTAYQLRVVAGLRLMKGAAA
ncbi:hypothetical protein AL036_07490 [Salipiger aestuarii]|uniref:hypothetical protein n=1 Tax=Salipiger aestuarii TaxID=568098 RepID=UPI00123A98A1|nr:hypothetical protein [Salipiger aestuarii]KAA8608307.1 hypothetical protein AL036_07490 [Salipiger aestuarii]KAA8612865.1 hypothetical protein AL037_07005 [Salipiger aestuarii]